MQHIFRFSITFQGYHYLCPQIQVEIREVKSCIGGADVPILARGVQLGFAAEGRE